MYRVLVPVDGETSGLQQTVEFLARFPTESEPSVIVLHARRDIDVVGAEGGRVNIDHEDLQVPDTLERLVDALHERGIEATADLREGDPEEAVAEAVMEHDIDQVVIPSRSRSPVGKFFFGSTTLDIIRESTVPVTVITQTVAYD